MNENKTAGVGGKPIFDVSFRKKECASESDMREVCIAADFLDRKGAIKNLFTVLGTALSQDVLPVTKPKNSKRLKFHIPDFMIPRV